LTDLFCSLPQKNRGWWPAGQGVDAAPDLGGLIPGWRRLLLQEAVARANYGFFSTATGAVIAAISFFVGLAGSRITVTHPAPGGAISLRTFNFYTTPFRGLESVPLQYNCGTAQLH
jgi:hypothetical protein